MKEFIIGNNECGQRFDKYLFKLLKNAGTGLLFKQLRNKNITLNGKKAKGNELLELNDCVRIFMSDETIEKFMGSEKKVISGLREKLKVVYEDENILLADKPVGVLSQKSQPQDISMNEYLLSYLVENGLDKESLKTFTPAFCNRLDRNTSGLMAAGKTLKGLQMLSEIIKERQAGKYYLAIVQGSIKVKGHEKGYLFKDEKSNKVEISGSDNGGDYIETSFEPLVIDNNGNMTLLKVKLITGKTHQIRAHLAYIGHPILGDPKYGNMDFNRKFKAKRQMLHSYEMVMPPLDGDFCNISGKSFKTDYPSDFNRYFEYGRLS